MRMAITDIVDLNAYPLDRPGSPARRALLDACQVSLAETGSCELPGFLRRDALEALVAEAVAAAPRAHRSNDVHNVFFEPLPATQDPADPLAMRQHSAKLTIAWDEVTRESPLRVLYGWDPLIDFVAEALNIAKLYRYDDKLGACSLAVFETGDELGWHFDRAAFAVTVMLQPAESGGHFDYIPGLRPDAGADPAALMARLGGHGEVPGRLVNTPGTLSLFRGHRSMHRVTPVTGERPRVNAVLAYAAQPAAGMNALTQRLFYGRVVEPVAS